MLLTYVVLALKQFPSCSCHLGKSIVYDTVGQLGWSVNVANHGIVTVINDVLSHPWAQSEKEGREVPEAKYEEDCVVSTLTIYPSIRCLAR